ncbi:MAG: S-methyl-5-thioribose-1-phosphate isomerase, partial [Candidatus Heimdallarchaeota archaeon]
MEDEIIFAINQRKLAFTFEIFEAKTLKDTCFAIKEMVVRGAPLIGV